ncbi:hypothetical protein CERZMDRAFT_117112 [Cercospora zeae-maydis SCOH1-5]|uniref:Major facilitator superfamily (MFS) profile domain-containing protein n=1 Tax=Cercospora zeae-maydis SCOH1-5 TaxID=717836 RepID=A0A6A6FKV0_9PEZI|nr:hypothetical protein CERZMDRAFT_117112 [Cercospora zeae-maydis SCOH1-5]
MATQESGNDDKPTHKASDDAQRSHSSDSTSKHEILSVPDTRDPSLSNNDSDARSLGGQRNTMSSKRLMVAVPALSVCLSLSFIDRNSVATATPAIAGDLDTGSATSWLGTSFLIASMAFQLITGRLSDIFVRENLLMVCMALLALGDLGCGFARTPARLFALRTTTLAPIIVILIVGGTGIGLTLQPGLIGTYANSNTADRAVATGLRNFVRTVGGAFGVAMSGVLLSNTLRTNLSGEPFVTKHLIDVLPSSTYPIDTLDISHAQKERILDTYMLGFHYTFTLSMAALAPVYF